MKNSNRKLIRAISFLTALVLVISVWAVTGAVKLNNEKKMILQANERALTELGEALDDINLNLQKAMYVNGGGLLDDLSAKLWRSSSKAKESLSEITDGNTEITDIYKFLSQVGEYTLAMSKNMEKNSKLTKEETDNLNKLLKYSSDLSNTINGLIEEQENGTMNFEEVKSTLQKEGDEKLVLGSELNDTAQTLSDYPTLIYDGPFSDHIQNKKSQLIESLKGVTEEKAKENAVKFLMLEKDDLKLLNKTQNNLSTYTFYNNDYTVSVTQKGGIVNYFLTSKYASEIKLTGEQAVVKAKEFLNKKGYKNVRERYFSTSDGICTVNFSYYFDDVTCYTDLIKVSVSLDSGNITAFDATGYLMNHKKRTIPKNIKYDMEKCAELLKNNLQVIGAKKAFIPTDWQGEYYVYEYHCKGKNGKELLVYIDPVTGEERDILLLLYSDGGMLTR